MKPFLGENFLLENKTAEILYHQYASHLPIIDYHNHLSPQEIAEDKKFTNLTAAWLYGDHYKWRAMRAFGINEKYITGNGTDFEKFEKWAATVPYTIRNPLFHWTHLELQRYFGISDLLSPQNAAQVYEQSTSLLQTDAYSTQGLLKKMNVEAVCSTDDPIDDLRYHQQLKKEGGLVQMYPAFRPDKAILIQSEGFLDYIQQLGSAASIGIKDFSMLIDALYSRMDYFHENGCRLADHGLEQMYAESFTDQEVNTILKERLKGGDIGAASAKKFMSAVLYYLSSGYSERAWVQQFHLGALRNNNTRLLSQLGPDTGFDSIGDLNQASHLSRFLDRMDSEDKLTKTIIYNLNPRDNEVMATMVGNYNDGTVQGKMQYGSAWWFLDQKDGMEKQLNTLSNMGLLSCFIGMLTDSRSFLSFPRHEYFRRLLCNLIGRDVHNGELPNDTKWLGEMVGNICYHNAKNYFAFLEDTN